ncbi:allantoicase-like [Anopheles nili]|uniref:allantoicase-like n=1 Tax=Anopheles nili TaxID=185578 RepID=UPI00237C1280|nr:allantoicase-like [Anopheles nili]
MEPSKAAYSEEKEIQPAFTELCEVASIGSNGSILFATDDFFAPAEGMLKDSDPVFRADLYTPYGKWMDGWETRRKRIAGHDWCLVELGAPAQIAGFVIDTAFFTGNYPPQLSISAGTLDDTAKEMLLAAIPRKSGIDGEESIGKGCTQEELDMVNQLGTDRWENLLPIRQCRVDLKPGYEQTRRHYFSVPASEQSRVVRHLRVNLFPDGGIARLRVHGTIKLNMSDDLNAQQTIDVVAKQNGGLCTGYSNAHYGHPKNLIKATEAANMGFGWETARRLDRPHELKLDEDNGFLMSQGSEWATFKLAGGMCTIERLCIDTKHFKGNFPDCVWADYTLDPCADSENWQPLLRRKKLGPDQMHVFEGEDLKQGVQASKVRITIAPDGGIARLRIFGKVLRS